MSFKQINITWILCKFNTMHLTNTKLNEQDLIALKFTGWLYLVYFHVNQNLSQMNKRLIYTLGALTLSNQKVTSVFDSDGLWGSFLLYATRHLYSNRLQCIMNSEFFAVCGEIISRYVTPLNIKIKGAMTLWQSINVCLTSGLA